MSCAIEPEPFAEERGEGVGVERLALADGLRPVDPVSGRVGHQLRRFRP